MKETRQSTTEQLRAVNSQDRTFDFVASSFALDSYGTRIDPNGWDFDDFKKNPVMCLQHDDRGYTGSGGLPVANAIPESIRVVGSDVLMTGRFPKAGVFPLADIVKGLVDEGMIRGVSVGFEPLEWEDVDEEADGFKRKVRVYRKQRLLEVSIVTIPSNSEALIQRAAKLNKDLNVIRRMTEQVEAMLPKAENVEKSIGTVRVFVAAEDIAAFDKQAEEIEKHRSYFEKKQPINKLASGVMDKFFKRILKEDQPADEAKAWERMSEKIEILEVKSEEITPPAIAVEAPQSERKASVQVPIELLAKLPQAMTRQLVDVGVEALRRGMTPKSADKLIDSLKETVSSAISL